MRSILNYYKSCGSAFHLVDVSPHPILVSFQVFGAASGLILYLTGVNPSLVWFSLLGVVLQVLLWLRDIIREGTYEGNHTWVVSSGLRLGFVLFVVSEVLFFFGFFFAYFWLTIAVSYEVGASFPGVAITPLEAFEIPLVNTALLLSLGASITVAHHALCEGDRELAIKGLVATIALSTVFTLFQVIEYIESSVSINDGCFGGAFFLLTGFHGFHVIVGTVMLIWSLIRLFKYEGSTTHHVGFESLAIYWHFVDVVWCFLFLCVYIRW